MRTLPLTVTATFAATLLLTSCGDSGSGGDSGDKKDRAGGSACAVDERDVQVEAGAAPAAGDTGNVTVTLTNRGKQCALKGFPRVDLVAGGTSATVPADPAAKAQPLTLAKDATASFTITYVRGETGGAKSLAVKKATFTLPGATTGHDFSWSYGDVALKGGAGKPDASVSAFQVAGD